MESLRSRGPRAVAAGRCPRGEGAPPCHWGVEAVQVAWIGPRLTGCVECHGPLRLPDGWTASCGVLGSLAHGASGRVPPARGLNQRVSLSRTCPAGQ